MNFVSIRIDVGMKYERFNDILFEYRSSFIFIAELTEKNNAMNINTILDSSI